MSTIRVKASLEGEEVIEIYNVVDVLALVFSLFVETVSTVVELILYSSSLEVSDVKESPTSDGDVFTESSENTEHEVIQKRERRDSVGGNNITDIKGSLSSGD